MSEYTVEQYAIERAGVQWDDQSERDVRGFDSEDEARTFFDEVDVRQDWLDERGASGPEAVRKKYMACELCRSVVDDDGYTVDADVVKYKEYGQADFDAEERG
ncbi:hypothetical protein [Eggerthella sinensis]|uniref:Uncharacterized protein n=1 Tax=Eggerthella sinensis TaxID=242230 RepID=A0A3N0ISS0_9ACTN|nr:hypothetical protein [Eggerthella sinensis]RDB70686.1 hypothetical protein C1876_02945 [Eggerthella sinensis]RNM39382.1 hypothetical protein DMP09_16800 [Eggerthella sinensis]